MAVARGLWPMIALRSLWLGALRGLWPMVLVEARKLWGLWPKLPPQTTRPKTHRLDKLFLYKAGLLALPGGEW